MIKNYSKDMYRPTWVEIDLKAVEHNFKLLRKIIGPKVRMLCVVKADAYGHGMLEISRRLVRLGVDYLGVASIEEGIKLRRAHIQTPILLFENILPEFSRLPVKYDLTASVCTKELAEAINRFARKAKKIARVHIKIDTGMGRLGVWHKEAREFICQINSLPHLKIEGLYTHFPSADSDTGFTKRQVKDFKSLVNDLEKIGIRIPICHIANSMGSVGYPESRMDMVRVGLALYGLYPQDRLKKKMKLRPALTLKSRIIFLKKVSPGRSISYGRTFICRRGTIIATLPVGYHDGYLRQFSNQASVLFLGRRYPVVGRVCMDQLMVDLGIKSRARIGDIITLVGRDKNEKITLEELARIAKTINYELACLIGSRAKRYYLL